MKNKKFISTLLTVTLVAVFMVIGISCNQSKLQLTVSLANSACPVDMGMGGTVESVNLENGNVIYTLKLNEQFANIAALEQNKDNYIHTITSLMSTDKNSQQLLKIMAEENAGLKYIVIGDQTGKKFSVELSPEQIKSLSTAPQSSPHETLLDMVKSTKVQLPMKVDVVTTMKDIDIEGDNVVYIYDIDENQINMNDVKIEVIRANTVGNLKYIINDVSAGQFFQSVIDDGKNVCYRYLGNKTGTKLEFVVSNGELSEIRSNAH